MSNKTQLVDTEGDFKYIGYATAGSSEAASVWKIKRIEFLVGDDVETKWAEGTTAYVYVWNDRATYTYSQR